MMQSSTCKTDDHWVALAGRGVGRGTGRTGEYQTPEDAEGQVQRQIRVWSHNYIFNFFYFYLRDENSASPQVFLRKLVNEAPSLNTSMKAVTLHPSYLKITVRWLGLHLNTEAVHTSFLRLIPYRSVDSLGVFQPFFKAYVQRNHV